MNLRLFAATTIFVASTNLSFAAADKYREHLPEAVIDMKLVDSSMKDGELIAYYGETIGRATLRIFPAPAADPNGASETKTVTSGETPAAQKALLDLLSRNLTEGTGALGSNYTTNPIRLFVIEVEGSSELANGSVACGFIERHQSEDQIKNGKKMVLADRVCLTQHDDDILAVSITTPYYPDTTKQDFNQAQITFSGLLIGNILAALEKNGTN